MKHSMVGQVGALQLFDKIRISLASPQVIRDASYGEVVTQETINYRTLKPEPGGLFACDIFGPVKDYECLCGKYKRMKYRGLVCEKCGVEVTTSKVRRERMGHIELAAPVAHIWFLKSQPSRIATLLDFPLKDLEKVLYFESHIVVDPGATPLAYGDLLSDDALMHAEDQYGPESFRVMIGAEAIKEMLKHLNLEQQHATLREQMVSTNSEAKRKRYAKRLQLIENFIESKNAPEWMVLDVLPVIPPDIRPLVMLDGGRFATSDLNEMYRRVIIRNNRLKRLIELNAPDIIIRNEKRMLQEAVDVLFDNGKRGRVLKNGSKRPFKSLSDMLKGKQGRFRQNLLGKRVDYSGRSVIVVGPTLKLHQCGLPKKMALELFKPFIYAKLELYGIATTIKTAKRMVEAERPEVWDILEEVIYEHPVLLNRAPTLHRLGIQAFEPLLIEGKAIQLHPLVCAAFNADFDGDQMAVHVPLSLEAQIESRVLMMSSNNILSPSHGKPIIAPSLDIVLGIYYATVAMPDQPGSGMVFSDTAEMRHALHHKVISLHSWIRCRALLPTPDGAMQLQLVETTPGRLMLAELLPRGCYVPFELFNRVLNKKEISSLIDMVYRHCGQKNTVLFADRIMGFGFKHACRSGVSIGKDDMVVPPSKVKHITDTLAEVKQYEMQHADGLITVGEKYNKVVDEWSQCVDRVEQEVMRGISVEFDERGMTNRPLNSIFMMANSGARGSAGQIKQIAGMRGLMVKPDGRIIEQPIMANFKEGLTMHECFISTHGTRKGLTDTALKTANSGYLTRRLVDVAQDCIVIEEDCGTTEGLVAKPVIQDGEVILAIGEVILGRVSAIEVRHPGTQEAILNPGELITEDAVERIGAAGIDSIKVRSVLTCKTLGGVCASCYGRDLATGERVSMGEAIGVVAAQSIGEPGTQLTMRTFHVGGAATRGVEVSSIDAPYEAQVALHHHHIVTNSQGHQIMMSRNAELLLVDEHRQEKARYKLPYGARLFVTDGAKTTRGMKLAEWDPYTMMIITEAKGRVAFRDMKEGVSVREIVDESIGLSNRVIIDSKQYARGADLRPHMVLLDAEGNVTLLANGLEAKYFLPVNAVLNATDGANVSAGDVLARIPRESGKTRDITGGLPRVVELVEARRPKDHAIISEIEGYVEFGKDYKSKRRIIINARDDNQTAPVEYLIPKGKHVTVNEGDYVRKGDLLMDGHPVPHEILKVMGVEALAHYMITEIQQVYRLQGVKIDDKHIEVILRQMLQKVEVEDAGETTLLAGEQIDREEFEALNEKAVQKGYKPAIASPVLQGITRASLQTRSWISAASFQQTTQVLTEAAVAGKEDRLRGLKENIIVGRLIPAGTGFYMEQVKKQALAKEQALHAQQLEEGSRAHATSSVSEADGGDESADMLIRDRAGAIGVEADQQHMASDH